MSIDDAELKMRTRIIIDEYNGISPLWQEVYDLHIKTLCQLATQSFALVKIRFKFNSPDILIFATLQEALIHAGAVSRFFLPPKNAGELAKSRGKKLREKFQICEKSQLFNRDLRNTIEHFDEKMDKFLLEKISGEFIPGPVVGSWRMSQSKIQHFFKLVDPEEEICIIFGRLFKYGEIRGEIELILKNIS